MANQKLTKANLLVALQEEIGELAPSRSTLETILEGLAAVAHKNLKAGLTVDG
jgi:hypothetical protein